MEFSVCYEHAESKKWARPQQYVFSWIYFSCLLFMSGVVEMNVFSGSTHDETLFVG